MTRSFAPITALLILILAIIALPAATQESEPIEWEDVPALPQAMSGHMFGVHNDALIAAGGTCWPVSPFQGGTKVWLDTLYVLEDGASEWQTTENLGHPVAYGAALSTPNGLLCAGGSDGERHYASVFMLAWLDGRLVRTELPDLPRPCAYTAGALLGNVAYVAGGQEAPNSTDALHSFWALDLENPHQGWQTLEPWPGPARILPVVAAQDGAVYVFSGADLDAGPDGKAQRTYLADGYCYRPDTAKELHPGWHEVAGPPRPVVAAPSCPFGPTHVFVFSGDDGSLVDRINDLGDDHPGFTHEVLAYHTITDSWALKGEVPESYVTTHAVLWRNRMVIAGGEDRPGHRGARVITGAPRGSKKRLNILDFAVMGAYFLALILIGFYFSKREHTTDDFFLGGKRIPWWAAGLSIYGTSLSAITFLAVPAESYARNWIFYVGNMATILVAPVVVFVYLPRFRGINITTAYEFLEKRFNIAVRLFGSCAFLLFQLGRVGIVLLLPAMALAATTGVPVPLAIVTMGILCMLYTVLGGIEAVIWTDVLQVIVLLAGAFLSLVLIVAATGGGLAGVIAEGAAADKFRLIHWGWDISKQVLWVVIIGRYLEAIIPYTSDQTIIQRYFTTATRQEAARSIWLCAI
ncbi:MAG TPA: sodium:solute symporter, partial [Candidatus Hydrogenedentes bacterium]|nr:sodium:solute symporter [Candidatus Hydrogenedentota bacterium]